MKPEFSRGFSTRRYIKVFLIMENVSQIRTDLLIIEQLPIPTEASGNLHMHVLC